MAGRPDGPLARRATEAYRAIRRRERNAASGIGWTSGRVRLLPRRLLARIIHEARREDGKSAAVSGPSDRSRPEAHKAQPRE